MGDESNTLPKQLHELREVVGQLEPDHLKDSQMKNCLIALFAVTQLNNTFDAIKLLKHKLITL